MYCGKLLLRQLQWFSKQQTLHYHHHLLLLHEEQWARGHDDRVQLGVEGNVGAAGPATAPNHNTDAGHIYQPKLGGWQWVRVRRVR